MPKISTYTTVAPSLSDKLIGTDVAGTPANATKNFTIGSVVDLIEGYMKRTRIADLISNVDQELTVGANARLQVSFGAPYTGDNFTLDSSGTVLCKIAGGYNFEYRFNSGTMQTGSGDQHVDFFYTVSKNGVQEDYTVQNTVYFDAGDSDPAQTIIVNFFMDLAVDDVVYAYQAASVYNPSGAGINKTGLIAKATSTSGMSAVPSSALLIDRLY
tara:strand:- start:2340 stop:2981 length:642 start_codon:yes stop_codon:yes gene_type:complete